MTKTITVITVMERKTQLEGTAVETEAGRYAVQFNNGTEKEVAPSTFKRNFKQLSVEQIEEVEEVATVFNEADVAIIDATDETAEGKKCRKISTIIEFRGTDLAIVEYNGFICDVKILEAGTDNVLFTSTKMSVKDTLENGYKISDTDQLKSARRVIKEARKLAKEAMLGE